VAIVLCLCGLQVSFYAQNATKLSPKVMAAMNAPLAELKDDDPPLIRLRKERFNAVLKEAKARIDVGQRLFAAEVDLYDQAEQKAQVLQRQLDVYTEAESNVEKWVKDGLATEAELERLRYNKFSVEIDLLKARGGQENQESRAQPTPQ